MNCIVPIGNGKMIVKKCLVPNITKGPYQGQIISADSYRQRPDISVALAEAVQMAQEAARKISDTVARKKARRNSASI